MTIDEKISNRELCNAILRGFTKLYMKLFPELRYIQALQAAGIIDFNKNMRIVDRFYEEPYDTIVRILPTIKSVIKIVDEEDSPIELKIDKRNIIEGLEKLKL